MSSEWRYYRSPRVRWVSGVGLSALIIGSGGLTAGYAAGKHPSIVLVVVFAVGVAGFAVNFVRFVSRAGVRESGQGLCVYGDFGGAHVIPWESIAVVAVRGRMAFVALHSGESRQLQVIQGSRTTWAGGETCDIAHVLVERANVVLNEMGKPANVQFRDLRAPTNPH